MLRYTIKRLLNLIPVALGVTLIIFTLLYITPGDPVKMMLGENIDQETYEMMREQMGLNDSFLQRYLRYVDDLFLHFDMGTSYTTKQPVITEILTCTPNTLKLTACSMAAAIVLGLFLGVIAAIRQNGIADSSITDRYFLSVLLAGADVDPVFLGSIEMVSIHGTGFLESICTALYGAGMAICCNTGQNDPVQYAGRDPAGLREDSEGQRIGRNGDHYSPSAEKCIDPDHHCHWYGYQFTSGRSSSLRDNLFHSGNRKTDGRLHQTT